MTKCVTSPDPIQWIRKIERINRAAAVMLLATTAACGDELDRPVPTHPDVAYGPHERNVLDFYQAESNKPTPVLVFFHGGGFRAGSKGIDADLCRRCAEHGISCAAANYRLTQHAPYPAAMHDSARAIQLLRANAAEWNIDYSRIAAIGNSAGAGIALWLAMHDDLADPDSTDKLAQQSTRLSCAIGLHAQTSYDPREIRRIVPGNAYDHSALKELFGLPADWDWDTTEVSESLAARLRDASPIEHLAKDDPPVMVIHHTSRDVPGEIHHANFGRTLEKQMEAIGVECVRLMTSDPADRNNITSRNQAIFDFVRQQFDETND